MGLRQGVKRNRCRFRFGGWILSGSQDALSNEQSWYDVCE
jgi:hypothetical protein